MFLSISKRFFTTGQTYQYFNNQRKLFSNCISFRCFECFTTTRSLPLCKGLRERTETQQPIKKNNKRANVSYLYFYTSAPATSWHRFETFNGNITRWILATKLAFVNESSYGLHLFGACGKDVTCRNLYHVMWVVYSLRSRDWLLAALILAFIWT